ncbi:S-layer homology domain-containing protein [Gorillibacterium sp. CAU 1737]|uniref:S-layer homology domain-containing protein n=1 Tax=Gorillibacterium sp. CAU 1737 TaxID=3140362 RepID=UPI0032610649
MKKVLTLFLAVSLVFGAFAGIAGAAELTTAQKYDAMAEAGIFNGNNANGDRDLDQPMTRAQLAKVITLTLGLTEDATAANAYKDIVSYHWGKPFIGAAVKAGIMNGVSATAFKPNANMTIEELATVLVRAAKLEPKADATVDGKVSVWAKGYVAAALEAKLIVAGSDYTGNALRSALVDGAYTLYAPKSSVAVDSAAAVGVKKFEVKFNQAVDTAKATFAVKKSNITVNVAKTTWSDDKKVATLELAAATSKGDYVVTVGGVVDPAVTKTVTVEDQKVAKIEFASEKAPLDRTSTKKISVAYKILNQYGEDITTAQYGDVDFTSSKGVITKANGSLSIEATTDFMIDEKVALNAFHKTAYVYQQQVLTVAPKAVVSTISIDKVANTVSASQGLEVGQTAANFSLYVTAKDQYGVSVDPTILREDVIVTISSPDLTFATTTVGGATYADFTKDSSNNIVLKLASTAKDSSNALTGKIATGGKFTATIYLKNSAGRASLDLDVKAAVKVATLSISASDLVINGEKNELPFTAADQFGNPITNADVLNATANFISAPTATGANVPAGALRFEQDYVNKTAKLYLDLTGATATDKSFPVYIYAYTEKSQVNTSLTVQANAIPKVVYGVKNISNNLAVEGTAAAATYFDATQVQVYDQYSRAKLLSDFSGYTVKVTKDSSDAIKVTPDGKGGYTVDAAEKGTSAVNVKLVKGTDEVAGSDINVGFRVVELADIAAYKVSDVAKLYAGTDGRQAGHTKAVEVVGLLADNTEVAVPANATFYHVVATATNPYYTVNGVNLTGTGASTIGPDKEVTTQVTVEAVTNAGTKYYTKDVVVSTVAPRVETTSFRSSGAVTKVSDSLLTVTETYAKTATATTLADLAVKTVDQYGVEITGAAKFASTSVSAFSVSGKTLNTVQAGQTFVLSYLTPSGKSGSITVQVIK